MEYMEQQMQNQIESGMSEAARCYDRIAELEAQIEQLSILCLAYEDKMPFPAVTKELFDPIFKARTLLAEIRAEAGRDGYVAAALQLTDEPMSWIDSHADKHAEQIRQGVAK